MIGDKKMDMDMDCEGRGYGEILVIVRFYYLSCFGYWIFVYGFR